MTKVNAIDHLERWLSNLQSGLLYFAEPRRLALLQALLLVSLIIWGAHSAARLLWVLWPEPTPATLVGPVVNPAITQRGGQRKLEVDLDAMLGLGLFGDPVNETETLETASLDMNPREGIESGARETRLELKLTGIVASTEDGLGTAVIEAKGSQLTYSVGDSLPAGGSVKLAKVLPQQVVLDNNGTYELLSLFDGQLPAGLSVAEGVSPPRSVPAARAPVQKLPQGGRVRIDERDTVALAAGYRDQLYENPQSLAEVVKVSAVRGPDGLRGYRVAPGNDARQFQALGFKNGDVVTAVNGLALSDPTNTMRLYQLMRDATEATFDVERDGDSLTISVSLNNAQ